MNIRQFADSVMVLAADTDGGAYRRLPGHALILMECALGTMLANLQDELARRRGLKKKPKLSIVK